MKNIPLRILVTFILAAVLLEPASAPAQDRVFISSRGTDEIRIYDAATGDFIETLAPADAARDRPQEVVFGPDGLLYVTFIAGAENGVIHRYDPSTGQDLGAFSSGYELDQPTKMRIGPDGHFYVSQWGGQKFNVAVFHGETGEFIREATKDTFRRNLMEMAWDDEGRLYVSHWGDGSNGFVRRFDAEGNIESTVIGSLVLQGPVNIWFNDDGTLNVVDWSRGRVDAFDITTGQAVRTRASGMQRAEGWTFGPDGMLYVCDWLSGRVNRYDPDTGAFVDTFIDDPGLGNPNSIKFEPASDVSLRGADEVPERLGLDAAYPNPFSVSTSIGFKIPSTSHVRLTVLDLFGRLVDVLVDERRPAGEYEETFAGAGLVSGVYLIRLDADGAPSTRIVTLLR
ncbi:MAG: T9SS type A sorting domain-containing protein [Rhodothermales bacterium]|nr:T9SS type A sorting domain-containing protein [Rhodothermales bacterium]